MESSSSLKDGDRRVNVSDTGVGRDVQDESLAHWVSGKTGEGCSSFSMLGMISNGVSGLWSLSWRSRAL